MLMTVNMMGASREALWDGLLMMFVGMGVVFSALILIMLMLLLMQQLNTGGKKVPAPVKTSPAPAPAAEPTVAINQDMTGIAPEIIAMISAAVVAVAGSRARIRSIRLIRRVGQSPWADQGRSRHHQSHRVHRGKR